MNSTPPRPAKNTFPKMGIDYSQKVRPKVIRNFIPSDPNLMETRVLGVFNPEKGKSWVEQNGKRVYYRRKATRKASRKSRKASRRNRRH